MGIEHTIIMSDEAFDIDQPVAPEGFDVSKKKVSRIIRQHDSELNYDGSLSVKVDMIFEDGSGIRFVDHIPGAKLKAHPELVQQTDLIGGITALIWLENLRNNAFGEKKVSAQETEVAGIIADLSESFGLELQRDLAKKFLDVENPAASGKMNKQFLLIHARHFNKYGSDMVVFIAGNQFDVIASRRTARDAINGLLMITAMVPTRCKIVVQDSGDSDNPQLPASWKADLKGTVRAWLESTNTN